MADDELALYKSVVVIVLLFIGLTVGNLYLTHKNDGGNLFGKYKYFTIFNLIIFTLSIILSSIIVADTDTDNETSDVVTYIGVFLPMLLFLIYGVLSFNNRQLAPPPPAPPPSPPATKGGGRRHKASGKSRK